MCVGCVVVCHVHILEPPSPVSRTSSLSPGAVCIAPPSFYLISPLCSLAKSHKSHRPSWRGFLRLRPNSPLLGTAFESCKPFLNPHVSVCAWPKALEGGHSQLVLFHGRDLRAGLEERRSLTNLVWASVNRSVNVWIGVLYTTCRVNDRRNVQDFPQPRWPTGVEKEGQALRRPCLVCVRDSRD